MCVLLCSWSPSCNSYCQSAGAREADSHTVRWTRVLTRRHKQDPPTNTASYIRMFKSVKTSISFRAINEELRIAASATRETVRENPLFYEVRRREKRKVWNQVCWTWLPSNQMQSDEMTWHVPFDLNKRDEEKQATSIAHWNRITRASHSPPRDQQDKTRRDETRWNETRGKEIKRAIYNILNNPILHQLILHHPILYVSLRHLMFTAEKEKKKSCRADLNIWAESEYR